ncbi:MAG: response regulator [Vicinamibacterales bacterium]
MTRILIVEDEGIIARDIQRQLMDLGYGPVDVAVDGDEAVATARRLRPELVLMDIHLAGPMDGIDAATAIQRELQIPCVFLTAYATNEVVERAKQADPSGYIIKPFDAQILRTTVEIALNKDRLNRQLRRSETVLAEAQRIAHIGSWEHDIATGLAYWSDESYAIMGNVPLGTPITFDTFIAAVHVDDRHLIDVMFQQSIRERSAVKVEFRVMGPDGSAKFVRGRCQAYFNEAGEPVRAAGTLQDVTEQHRSEELLRLQGAALDSSAIAVVITDRNGTIEWVNPAFTAGSGYSLEEAVGRNTSELLKSGVHDEAFFRHLWGTIVQGHVWTGEITNRRKDGSLYREEQTITPVRNAAGTITHFVGVKRDLTEQKRLEQQFLQAQKMEVIGRLAGGVAHDFNNLLTVINGTCELALMELPIGHPMRAEFEEIQGAGDRAARLTKQLLAFSRKQMLAPAVVNVGAQVTQSAKMLRRLIGEDITLVLDVPEDDRLHVFADTSQLEQVMLNLAVNARDAMPDGGTLTISTTLVTLDPEFAALHEVAAGPYVKLSVADTGSGMTQEVRERIFEPFFTTKAAGKGTGLGLATVYGVVHQSGGTIEVVSKPGHGARFNVYFPQVLDSGEKAVVPQSNQAPGSETILLVEDETSLRDMTARMLESAGYRVMTAHNGEDALELLHDYPATDLVITDVVMPGMSGPDLALKLSAVRPGLKVLFVSGYTDDKLGAVLTMNGANFLPKPFTVTMLTRKVRQILDAAAGQA